MKHRTWTVMLSSLLFSLAGVLAACNEGGSIMIGDDDVADDDTGDDDVADDDVADDDVADDDVADDDTGDDDTEDPGCPWDGSYEGRMEIDMGYWVEECGTSAEVVECELTGLTVCEQGWGDDIEMPMTGHIEESGAAAGELSGEIGWGETFSTEWTGQATGAELTGSFIIDTGWDEIHGEFALENQG